MQEASRVFSGFRIWPKFGKTIDISTGSGIWLLPGSGTRENLGKGCRIDYNVISCFLSYKKGAEMRDQPPASSQTLSHFQTNHNNFFLYRPPYSSLNIFFIDWWLIPYLICYWFYYDLGWVCTDIVRKDKIGHRLSNLKVRQEKLKPFKLYYFTATDSVVINTIQIT